MSGVVKSSVKKSLRHQQNRFKRLKETQTAVGDGHSSASPLQRSTSPKDVTLRNAYLGWVKPSSLDKKSIRALTAAPSKSNAMETFQLLTSASNESLSVETMKALSSSLVKLQVKEALGETAYRELLRAAVGSEDERWGGVSVEEENAFALYQRKQLERHGERGFAFNQELGAHLEGSDNDRVALIEFQLRKHTNTSMVPVSNDVLADLMHLDVSWTAALRLLQYAKELNPTVPPSTELLDRVSGLMTGYKSNGIGSRPWVSALQLYQETIQSGYEVTLTTHTHALDALWRSNDTFHKVNTPVNKAHQQWILQKAKEIKKAVDKQKDLVVRGEEGCNYIESLVKTSAAAGEWQLALQFLFSSDLTTEDTTHHLLIPTAETFAFAMTACNVCGNATHSFSLQQMFKASYTWRSLHSEVLNTYLQSLRHVARTAPWVGDVVEDLVKDGKGLDRPCALACLQLLTMTHVNTETSKPALAEALFKMFDANIYISQPLARKIELQTLFRCCYIIEARDQTDFGLIQSIRKYFVTLFGNDSPEVEWLDDTEIYALQSTVSWESAMRIYEKQVLQRPPSKVKYLPVPLRQIRHMCCTALLASCRIVFSASDRDAFLLDEETESQEVNTAVELAERVLDFINHHLVESDGTVGQEALAEILLLQSAHLTDPVSRAAVATKGLHLLAQLPEHSITPHLLSLASKALNVSESHLTSLVKEDHAAFRGSMIAEKETAVSPLEKVYV